MPGREEALERARAAAAKTRSEFREVDGQLTSPYPAPRRRGQQGPASDLPTENPAEMYSDWVPAKRFPAGESQNDWQERSVGEPFGREFDFTDEGSRELPRGYTPGESGTIADRSKRFIDQYFGGVDSEVRNPATGRLYGKELKVHDALHDYMNVSNTLRGEELVTIGENIANTPLSARNIGLTGLTQQGMGSFYHSPADIATGQVVSQRSGARMSGPILVQQRGATRGSSLFRDRNNPASFLSPPITEGEFGEVTRRAREFYDQVHAGWAGSGDQFIEDDAIRHASKQFIEGHLQAMPIEGGYRDPGGMPYGPKEQLMNPPLVPVVNATEHSKSIKRQLQPIAKRLAGEAMDEFKKLDTLEQDLLRQQALGWDQRANVLKDQWRMGRALNMTPHPALADYVKLRGEFDPWLTKTTHEEAAEAALGPRPQPLQPSEKISQYVMPYSRSEHRRVLMKPDADTPKAIQQDLGEIMDLERNMGKGGTTGGLFASYRLGDEFRDGRQYLNPPNLGSNQLAQRKGPLSSRTRRSNPRQMLDDRTMEQILLNAAVDAKDKFRVKSAIRAGFGAATDTIGSVPLLDPGFRAAVNKGDARGAGAALATDLVAGAAAAPVIGAGAGVLQRAAPRAAARALPAIAGVSRLGNPVAVASQLGGDRQLTKAQEVADRQAGEAQQNRARLARQRGGRISFPTPFGKVTLRDYGISESGGLFSGGNTSGRRIGTRSVLGGKTVVWTGDSYGWQSPAAASKVGVR